MRKKIYFLGLFFLFCLINQGVWARVFTAKDNAFTIDLPATWSEVESPNDYLFLKNKSGATMRFVIINDCFDRQCLDSIVDKEIKDLTKRKFTIIKDEYTGEFVRETAFSTKDPLLSFDFTKQNMLFTAGYFLSGGKAYNVGVRGIPYTEAFYLLSFISPVPKEEVDTLQSEVQAEPVAGIEPIEQSDLLETENTNTVEEKPKIQVRKKETPKVNLPHKSFQIVIIIALCYLMLWGGAFFFKTFFPEKIKQENANPNSPYPLRGKRLYGSPDLFMRLHDNLGNHYIATGTRWGGIFVLSGLVIFLIFNIARICFTMLAVKATHPSLIINTCYSLSYLLSACGFIIFLSGIVLNLVFPYKFVFYDGQGNLLYKCVQKGWHLTYEQYFAVNGEGKILCKFKRRSFLPLRKWEIFDADNKIAEIKEQKLIKALLRHLLGHLFGFLRASYFIKAQADSSGEIKSVSCPALKFNLSLDKPQAVSSEIMLIFSGILFMRDRDKSFPWIN